MGSALLICSLSIPGRADTEICVVQYMEVIPPPHTVGETLRSLCLRWDTGEQCDFETLLFWSAPLEASITVGAWYGNETFQSVTEVFYVL